MQHMDAGMQQRVLHVTGYVDMKCGSTNVIYHMSQVLREEGIIFDYLALKGIDEETRRQIEALGGVVYDFPDSPHKNPALRQWDFLKSFKRFLKEHPYKVLHWDTENPLKSLQVVQAKKAGVLGRIIHSHAAAVQDVSWISNFVCGCFRIFFKRSATDYVACSTEAANWMFPGNIRRKKKYTILKNGIAPERFAYSESERMTVRKKLGWDDALVLGHVGRLSPIKNHKFLLQVLCKLKEMNIDARLLLVGEGELKEELQNQVHSLGLDRDVCFAGATGQVETYLQAMDVFLFPSVKEGLGIAAIEAQAAGLPCVMSTGVPKEAKVLSCVEYCQLDEKIWADTILRLKEHRLYEDCSGQIRQQGYDIADSAKKLGDIYRRYI